MTIPDETRDLILQCDIELASCIQSALKDTSASKCRVAERRNIHGEASTCVLIATLAIKELPVILERLKDLVGALPIRRLQYGDYRVANISSRELMNILSSKPTKTARAVTKRLTDRKS